MDTTVKFYSLSYSQLKTYLIAAALIAGNILLPLLFHAIPQGGRIFLPIYFFTLLGAYKYGLKPGLLIAVLSPLVNYWLTGMPPVGALPVIIAKSCLLAVAASFAAKRFHKATLLLLAGVVFFYQSTGFIFEWIYLNDILKASQDIRMALPGMLLQVFGIYGLMKLMQKYGY